jgi:hypothetical protein
MAHPRFHAFVKMSGVEDFHAQCRLRAIAFCVPASSMSFYGARAINVTDPFGNRISFNEFKEPGD